MVVPSCPVDPADVKKALGWLNAIKPKGLVSELRFNAGIRSDAVKRRGLKKLASPPASVQIVRDIKLLLNLFDAKAKFQEKVQAGINSLVQEFNLADAKLLHDEANKVWGLDLKLPEIDAEQALKSVGEIKSKDDLRRVVMLATLMHCSTDPYQYSESQKFIEDSGIDSLDTVEFIMSLEKKLGIEVPDEEAEKFVSPQATIDYLLDLPRFSDLK